MPPHSRTRSFVCACKCGAVVLVCAGALVLAIVCRADALPRKLMFLTYWESERTQSSMTVSFEYLLRVVTFFFFLPSLCSLNYFSEHSIPTSKTRQENQAREHSLDAFTSAIETSARSYSASLSHQHQGADVNHAQSQSHHTSTVHVASGAVPSPAPVSAASSEPAAAATKMLAFSIGPHSSRAHAHTQQAHVSEDAHLSAGGAGSLLSREELLSIEHNAERSGSITSHLRLPSHYAAVYRTPLRPSHHTDTRSTSAWSHVHLPRFQQVGLGTSTAAQTQTQTSTEARTRAYANAHVEAEARLHAALQADLQSLSSNLHWHIPVRVPHRPVAPRFGLAVSDSGRVYPYESCSNCRRLMKEVATVALKGRLNRYNTVVQVQVVCIQLGVGQSLDLQVKHVIYVPFNLC